MKFLWLVLCLFSVTVDARSESVPVTFEEGVIPFIDTYCIGCHASDIQEGDTDLETLQNIGEGPEKERETWKLMLKQLKEGEMPPEDEDQPSPEERAAIVDWLMDNLGVAEISEAAVEK